MIFPRLNDQQMKNVKFEEDQIHFYSGPKEPAPPPDFFCDNPLLLRELCQRAKIVDISKNTDFDFIESSISANGNIPDYHGFNTLNTSEYTVHFFITRILASLKKVRPEILYISNQNPIDDLLMTCLTFFNV